MHGSVAQLVEQRPEEPCVAGSSPAGTTIFVGLYANKAVPRRSFVVSQSKVRLSRNALLGGRIPVLFEVIWIELQS